MMRNPPDEPDDGKASCEKPLSDEEKAFFDRPLNEILGVDIQYAADDLAPPVDERRLLAFLRGHLPPLERREVTDMIASFRSWHDALKDLLRRESS